MKKVKGIIASLLTLTFFSSATLVVEADTDVPSRADVEFMPNGNSIPPVDPDEGDDINENRPPTEGPLSINYASNLVFGQHKKTRKEQLFYAQEDIITVIETGETKETPNFVQVTDLRGTATGWSLNVRQNGPLKKENGASIVGSKLTVSARSIESMYGMTDVPSGLATEQVLLDDGQSHEIVKAEAGTGVSTWNTFLGTDGEAESGISLTVPDGSVKEIGVYTTSLTWLLQDVL